MICGIRTPFIDELVEYVLISYGCGDSVREIHKRLTDNGTKINENTLYAWIKKAKAYGYYSGRKVSE